MNAKDRKNECQWREDKKKNRYVPKNTSTPCFFISFAEMAYKPVSRKFGLKSSFAKFKTLLLEEAFYVMLKDKKEEMQH